jgi:hypothetical protein
LKDGNQKNNHSALIYSLMGKYVRNYNSFLESKIFEINDNELFNDIFINLLNNKSIDESIREEIKSFMILHEGFFDKLKQRFPKATEVSNLLSDKAEKMLGDLIQKAKDAVSFVKKIVSGIKEFFIKGIENGKSIFTEQIKQGKLKDKIEELANTKKDGLKKDLSVLKEVITWYRKEFLGKLTSSVEKNMTDFTTKEQEPIAESFNINEGKNVISTLIHGLESIPPFSWLQEVAKAGEAGTNNLIKAISDLTKKLGGPEIQLPVIALLIGITIEQIVKNTTGHWILEIVGSTTPIGQAISALKMIAAFIALIVAIDGVVGEKILGGHHDGHHKKEEEDVKQDDQSGENKVQEKPEQQNEQN